MLLEGATQHYLFAVDALSHEEILAHFKLVGDLFSGGVTANDESQITNLDFTEGGRRKLRNFAGLTVSVLLQTAINLGWVVCENLHNKRLLGRALAPLRKRNQTVLTELELRSLLQGGWLVVKTVTLHELVGQRGLNFSFRHLIDLQFKI